MMDKDQDDDTEQDIGAHAGSLSQTAAEAPVRPSGPSDAPAADSDLLFSQPSSQLSALSTARRFASARGQFRRGDITPSRALAAQAPLLNRQTRTPLQQQRPPQNFLSRVSEAGATRPVSLSSSSSLPVIPSTDLPYNISANGAGDEQAQQTQDSASPETFIWGTTVNIDTVRMAFRDFLARFTKAYKIEALLRMREEDPENFALDIGSGVIQDSDRLPFYPPLLKDMKESCHTSLNLDCSNLRIYGPTKKLYVQLLRYPQEVVPLLDHTLVEYWYELFEDEARSDVQITVRPFNLHRCVNLRELDPADVDQLICVKGLMIRCSSIIPDMKEGFFQCTNCDQPINVENDRGRITEPTVCPRQDCGAKNSMRLIHNRCVFSDKQVCRMQETPDETPDGQTPYTVSMCVYDELVDVAKPGDRYASTLPAPSGIRSGVVEITGIFRAVPVRVNERRRTIKSLFKTYVDVVHVKRTDSKRIGMDPSIMQEDDCVEGFNELDNTNRIYPREEEILQLAARPNVYELLARSVAPSIYGMEDVKKGALLQLFGGTNKGDINVLVVGDPGVSKSQLLKYVHMLAPRGIYTSGKGSSAVGLTAYITRDPDTRQLVLESGALVLSDGGVCCIDEFDKMTDYTRSVLHEVMEQQTISVAKAGIITTLNARTSILASANPINSKFDEKLSVVENVNLPPPLVSRFDLLFLVLDRPNENEDRILANYLTGLYMDDSAQQNSVETVGRELFTKYISYAREKVNPVITEEAGKKLVEYYLLLRNLGNTNSYALAQRNNEKVITATTRQLESMIRLSEAHAKMRLRASVDVEDVEEAYRLMVTALKQSATDPLTGRLDYDMLATGISSRARAEFVQLKENLVKFVTDICETRGATNSGRTVTFARLVTMWKEQAGQTGRSGASESQLLEVVEDIRRDMNCPVYITGRSANEFVFRLRD
ncbi:hypothetical protein HDU84_002005 [Entophlyctis sp. JEL0112]|nr:hypothetical protein HDU84_002005 [Entophlyctis sp. JEL0112]